MNHAVQCIHLANKCLQVGPKVLVSQIQKHWFCSISFGVNVSERDFRKGSISLCQANRKLFQHSQNEFLVHNSFEEDKDKLEGFNKFDKALETELQDVSPPNFPSYSDQFADYVNSSKILQALLLLGVNLSTVQRKWPECLRFLVTLNFKNDIKPKLDFLLDLGITVQEFGDILTKYIMILDPEVTVEVLKESTDYLLSKKFTKKEVASIVSRYPQFFNVPFVRLDGILGFYQNLPTNYETRPIHFNGQELRSMIVRCPQLMTSSLEEVYLEIKTLERSCEFTVAQIRQLVYHRPQILLADFKKIERLYKFYANEMDLTNEQMAKNAFVFFTRLKLVQSRHRYLKYLGRDKYKEDEPGYISLYNLVCSTNEEFCAKCQLGPFSNFEKYMKTL